MATTPQDNTPTDALWALYRTARRIVGPPEVVGGGDPDVIVSAQLVAELAERIVAVEEHERTDRALEAMARIVRDWDVTAYQVATEDDSSELRSEPGGDATLGKYSYRPWISDQDIDLLRWYVESHKAPVGTLFSKLLEAVSERFDLDYDQAMRFIRESCNAGGLLNLEKQPELVEALREAALDEPDIEWLLDGEEDRGDFPPPESTSSST